jgi:protein gp37
MTDLFGEWLDEKPFTWSHSQSSLTFVEECISETFPLARSYNNYHTVYLWLTKRVERMCNTLRYGKVDIGRQIEHFNEMLFWPRFDYGKSLLSNNYFGFTAENQKWFAKRGDIVMKKLPEWVNLWVSMEPLLGPINAPIAGLSPLPKWVVVGCESGPNRRPCKIEWIESIVDQCLAAKVPVFVKQLDIDGKCERDISKFPEHLRIRQVPWA